MGDACPGRCFAALPRKARYFGADGGRGCCANLSLPHFWSVSPPQITLGILARTLARATLAIAVSGRGEIPHWR